MNRFNKKELRSWIKRCKEHLEFHESIDNHYSDVNFLKGLIDYLEHIDSEIFYKEFVALSEEEIKRQFQGEF